LLFHTQLVPPLLRGNLKATNMLIAADGLDGMLVDINTTPPSLDGMEQSVVNYYDPEFLKTGAAKPASDVYSMGVILLELLTSHKGQVPSLNGEEEGAGAGAAAAAAVAGRAAEGLSSGGGGGGGGGGADPMDALQAAAVTAGWPTEVAREVVALAAACVRPHAERRKVGTPYKFANPVDPYA
jgi:serine/threonine protein kinase